VKYGLLVLGIVLLGVGALFSLQGLGIVKGSFMTGQGMWLWVGLACVVLGAAVIASAIRLRAR
jgi:hypothetical protein